MVTRKPASGVKLSNSTKDTRERGVATVSRLFLSQIKSEHIDGGIRRGLVVRRHERLDIRSIGASLHNDR